MAGEGELLFERRQGGAGLSELRLLREHRGLGNRPQFELPFHQRQLFALGRQHVVGGGDLGAKRGFLDGGGRQVRGQRQIGRLVLKALVIDLGGQAFELPPRGAEQVEGVGDVDRGIKQAELLARSAEGSAGDALAGGPQAGIDAGVEQGAARRPKILPRFAQGGLGCAERRVLLQPLFDQRIESGGAKQCPPLGSELPGKGEALGGAPLDRGARRLLRERRGGVGLDGGGRRRPEIGADHAPGEGGGRDAGHQQTENIPFHRSVILSCWTVGGTEHRGSRPPISV